MDIQQENSGTLMLKVAPTHERRSTIALYLRLVVVITNYKRRDNPGNTIITL
jgi:hypothetical protein